MTLTAVSTDVLDRALNLHLDGAETIILMLARVVETRDLYTVHHSERVGRFAREIGRARMAWTMMTSRCCIGAACRTISRKPCVGSASVPGRSGIRPSSSSSWISPRAASPTASRPRRPRLGW